jgi:type I restriction enzyme, R subunit
MNTVGQREKKTQARVVKLFRDTLKYDYLGDWTDRPDNRNIEENLLHSFLTKQGHDEALIRRTLYILDKAAGDQSKSLYDRNKAVYELLRYGVKVKPEVGEQTRSSRRRITSPSPRKSPSRALIPRLTPSAPMWCCTSTAWRWEYWS